MTDSHINSQSHLTDFRTDIKAVDISFQGQQLSPRIADLELQRTNIDQQMRYFNTLLNHIKSNQDISGFPLPASVNISDPGINNLISEIIKTYNERSTFTNRGEKNIFLAQIEKRIESQKNTIVEAVTNNMTTLNLTLNEINYKSEKLAKDISNIPRQEMKMVNIQRKFDLDNTVYTTLLQKRSEAAISLSSTFPDYEVIEPAREITSQIISPKRKLNYFIAFFLSLLLPTIYLILKTFLTDKIININDIERIIDRSVFGIIYNNSRRHKSVFQESSHSAVAESFRNLRSSLFLKLKSEKSKVILITSSQPQDGKSFISFNLASSIASVGLKTVLIDADLRRPVLHNNFDNKNLTGLSNFLVKAATEEQIINETPIENLHFIPAGPILPNPSELIGSGLLDSLFKYLESNYDYIVIDTPPLGMVADSLQLMKYASQFLVVSRINHTKKEFLNNALFLLHSNKLDKFEVIVNDQTIDNTPYSKYKSYYVTKDA
jgi:capsular exopolysaccharide synthesis family protein